MPRGAEWQSALRRDCGCVWRSACCRARGFVGEARAQAVIDEAKQAGRSAQSFPAADEDYFRAMDGGVPLTPDEVKGRNMWLVWTGGNDRLWDELTNLTFGSFDLLKILSSYPGLKYSRDNRWNYFGLVNEPCFTKATGPNPQRYGLWLDVRDPNCPPDPFENAEKYPGVAVGARGKNIPSRVLLRVADRDRRVAALPQSRFRRGGGKGVGCRALLQRSRITTCRRIWCGHIASGCLAGFVMSGRTRRSRRPIPRAPQWENLSSTVGAQYFWVDRIFAWNADQSTFFFQFLHTSRPGSLDTSLVSSDNINNPRTMNAVYNLLAAAGGRPSAGARRHWAPTISPTSSSTISSKPGPLTQFFQPPNTVWTPHVLKDGADSVGALGALNRVYLNIGLFSEEWLRHFNPILGGKPITPIEITTARANSTYWDATEMQTPDMALFLRQGVLSAQAEQCAGRRRLPQRPARRCPTGQDRSLPKIARHVIRAKRRARPARANPAACIGPATSNAGTAIGSGPKPSDSGSRCARSSMPTIFSTTIICRTTCACR